MDTLAGQRVTNRAGEHSLCGIFHLTRKCGSRNLLLKLWGINSYSHCNPKTPIILPVGLRDILSSSKCKQLGGRRLRKNVRGMGLTLIWKRYRKLKGRNLPVLLSWSNSGMGSKVTLLSRNRNSFRIRKRRTLRLIFWRRISAIK